MNALDLLVLIALLLTAYGGYKNGFTQRVFKTIGYIAGGVAGVTIALRLLDSWSNILLKIVVSAIIIFLFAIIGEYVSTKVGLGFKRVLFIPPFKIIDSLLGATLSFTRTVLILYLLSLILRILPDEISSGYLYFFESNTYTDSNIVKIFNYLDLQIKQSFY